MDVQLDDDQSDAFCSRQDDKVMWHLRSINSPILDVRLVYDITNDNRYPDNNIYYSCMVKFNNKYYAGSALNSDILEDSVSYSDNGL